MAISAEELFPNYSRRNFLCALSRALRTGCRAIFATRWKLCGARLMTRARYVKLLREWTPCSGVFRAHQLKKLISEATTNVFPGLLHKPSARRKPHGLSAF